MMHVYVYDKTFAGLLTVVFEAYAQKKMPNAILGPSDSMPLLYDELIQVTTVEECAERVWNGLHKKLSKSACQMLYTCFLSEQPTIESTLFCYIRKAFDSSSPIETNFADEHVLALSKLYRKVRNEANRMRMFVRFQKTADGLFFAPIEPLYNVLPLVSDHFEDRFADQKWVIYDLKRGYGLYYDLEKVQEVRIDELAVSLANPSLDEPLMSDDEQLFQNLWRGYIKSATIKERINPKLHVQMLPRRFWKYLPEKNGKLL